MKIANARAYKITLLTIMQIPSTQRKSRSASTFANLHLLMTTLQKNSDKQSVTLITA